MFPAHLIAVDRFGVLCSASPPWSSEILLEIRARGAVLHLGWIGVSMGDHSETTVPPGRGAWTAAELVFAIAHEIGNHLGGIRLHAHLLDEDLDARSLADASVSIDSLAGRAGPLLSLVRPLLSPEADSTPPRAPDSPGDVSTWGGILERVGRQIDDQGTQGVRFSVEPGLFTDRSATPADWLHPLLITLIESTLAEAGRGGFIRLAAEEAGGGVTLVIEDDSAAEDLSPAAPLRGRPLAVSIARELLGRKGGQVETDRASSDLTRVRLRFGGSSL